MIKINIMSTVIMACAIGLGTIVGNALGNMIGLAGGIIGTIIVGFVVYLLFAFLSGMPIRILAGVVFAIMVWIANMIAGKIHTLTGFGGGIIGLLISAFIMMFLWGNFGASISGQATSTAKTSHKKKRR